MKQTLVTHFLEHQVSKKIAIVDRMGEITYRDLNLLANKVAKWLIDLGVTAGDNIVVCGHNSSRIVAALFGILKIGARFVPVHTETPTAKFEFILRDCFPKAMVIDRECVKNHEKSILCIHKSILIISDKRINDLNADLDVTYWFNLPKNPEYSDVEKIPESALAAIVYTSGSSKNPKGVMLPHRQVVFVTTAINRVIGNKSDDVILCGLPLSFDYGLYQIFLAFQVGAKVVLEPNFNVPMAIPRLINDYQVTGFPGVPALFGMLLRSRLLERVSLPSLEYITSTGDVFPVSQINKLQELLPQITIFPMYGLTECKRVSIVPRGCLRGHEASVGLPLPGTKVAVVDETGNEVSPEVVGELLVYGPHIMAGYWNDKAETRKRFQRDKRSGELVLHTGDNFYINRDGFLYFVGRREIFIKTRGIKVSPIEVESIILNLEGVAEAAVMGVPDPNVGEAILAFVSLTSPDFMDISTIEKYCKQNLPIPFQPSKIIILKSLPKTLNGKIDRKQLLGLILR